MMKIVTIILARGGSKGIPKKNIVKINGKPLISYTIDVAKKTLANNIWVSTDCSEIKQVALQCDVNVIDRPNNISGDLASSEEALLHFANNVDFDAMVFIQPTSPLVNKEDIDTGINLILKQNYDSVFSVYKEHWIPRWSLSVKPIDWDIQNRPRRQDINENYVENGAFYITTKEQFINSKLRYGGRIGTIEMPLSRNFQIDTFDDLKLIESLIKNG